MTFRFLITALLLSATCLHAQPLYQFPLPGFDSNGKPVKTHTKVLENFLLTQTSDNYYTPFLFYASRL